MPKNPELSANSYNFLQAQFDSKKIKILEYKSNGIKRPIVIAEKDNKTYAIILVSRNMENESSTYSYPFDSSIEAIEKYCGDRYIPAVWHYVQWRGNAEGVVLPTSQIRELLSEDKYFSLRATDPNIIYISCGAINIGLLKAISEF